MKSSVSARNALKEERRLSVVNESLAFGSQRCRLRDELGATRNLTLALLVVVVVVAVVVVVVAR